MSASTGPNPVTAPDSYGARSGQPGYLACQGARVLTIQISNAAIVYQIGRGDPPYFDDQPEKPLLPVVGSINEPCDAIRYRNQTPGVPAQVQITTRP